MSRSAGLVLEAAPTDADMQALADRLAAQRATTVAWIVDGLRQHAALRAGLTRRHEIDQVWLLMDPAVYQRLTRYRGWRPAQYERWLVDSHRPPAARLEHLRPDASKRNHRGDIDHRIGTRQSHLPHRGSDRQCAIFRRFRERELAAIRRNCQ